MLFIPSNICSYKGFNVWSVNFIFDLNISLAPLNKDDFLNPVLAFNNSIYFFTNSSSNLTISPIQVPTYLLVVSTSKFGVFNNHVIKPSIFASVILIFFFSIKLRNSFNETRLSWSGFWDINLLINPTGLLTPIFPTISETESEILFPIFFLRFSNLDNNSSWFFCEFSQTSPIIFNTVSNCFWLSELFPNASICLIAPSKKEGSSPE